MKERRASQKLSSKSIMDPNQNVKCKIVVVGDSQCGKTALLHVFAKDCFPENYVPTVFENYTASFEIDTQRIELSLWDTSGSPYYDKSGPFLTQISDAVLICFDISRPETLEQLSSKRQWKGEIQEFVPTPKCFWVGCKSDLRTDVSTLVELSNHRQTPVSYDQGANMAKQIGAATYIECSALQSENSVRDIFHVATLACVNKTNKNVKRNKSQRTTSGLSHMPSRPELSTVATDLRKDKAKSCTVM
ncbi:LOW QUALITY PROTEIN: rho-related GTP-binding protein RhoE [Choloepus didactylus]|uniref:LOW QUALITY PROTEIN: rho-related GTP-binding protein RhoE n=1 Tax=Choloepus didactylus TaxID=27675 RepID=UPI00189D6316|nr:LOW QUALITY PROTEIN: rho-related GTP-binding protein RhoE [Choloepus didactylus]